MRLGIFTALFGGRWRRVMTALISVGYDYVMSPEDGAEKAIAYLRPLVIKKPLTRVWW